jgi:hypothetical protein
MTFASLALLAISTARGDWLGAFFESPKTVIRLNDETDVTIRWFVGNVVLTLLALRLAYLWRSTGKPN